MGEAGTPALVNDVKTLYQGATEPFLRRLLMLYPASGFNSTFWRRSSLFSDATVCCPTYLMNSAMSSFTSNWKMIFRAGTGLHGANGVFLWTYGYGSK